MALTREQAQPVFEALLDAGYKAVLCGWQPRQGWKHGNVRAFSVTASSMTYEDSAGVVSTELAAMAAIGSRHGLTAYFKTFEVEGYEGERNHYGAYVDFYE